MQTILDYNNIFWGGRETLQDVKILKIQEVTLYSSSGGVGGFGTPES